MLIKKGSVRAETPVTEAKARGIGHDAACCKRGHTFGGPEFKRLCEKVAGVWKVPRDNTDNKKRGQVMELIASIHVKARRGGY